MARKRSTKDFAISMDEFHPRPSTAAAFADRKANDACQEHLRADLKRVEAAKVPNPAEKSRITALLAQTEADRVRIDELISEARVK